MKKSEMINKIARWLDRNQSTVLMNGNEGVAKSLLHQIELWGMFPPEYRKEEGIDIWYPKEWEKEIVSSEGETK